MQTEFDAAPRAVAARFTIEADPSPGLLPRLLQPFAKRDLTPDRMRARCHGQTMHVVIALATTEPGLVRMIVGNLQQVIGVRSVLVAARLPRGAVSGMV